MWMHGDGMTQGTHMMMGTPGMMIFGLLYILAVLLFFWFLLRGVRALERIADNTEESSKD